MTFDQLRAVQAIFRERGFSRAAEKLFITQPALSMQIKALEEELDDLVFERTGRRVVPTEAGRILYQHANSILAELATVREEIDGIKGLSRGTISVGCSDTLTRYFLLPVLSRFSGQHPGIQVKVWNKTTPQIVQMLLDGEAEVGIVTMPVERTGVSLQIVGTYEDVAVCSPNFELAGRRSVDLETLSTVPLLLLEPGTRSRERLKRSFSDARITLKSFMDLGSVEVQKDLARIGTGVAIVPDFAVAEDVAQKTLIGLSVKGLPKREIAVITRSSRELPSTTRAFLGVLEESMSGR